MDGSGGIGLSATATPTSCGQANGTVTIDVTGGTGPYNWTGPNGTSGSSANEPFTITGVPGGVHTFTVTDASGCSGVVSVNVPTSTPLSISLTSTPATCGDNNGTITVDVTGGTPDYNYNWTRVGGGADNGMAMSDPFDIAGLMAGTYNITVTDISTGCTATGQVTVNSVSGISISATPTPPACGQLEGSILVDVINGTAQYTYQWAGPENGNFGPTNTDPYTIPNLLPGVYTITVTDGNNCMAFATVTIAPPPSITATATATNTTCGLANGSATASGSGGTAPYTYMWSNGGTTATINNPVSYTHLPVMLMTVTTVLESGESDQSWDAGFNRPAEIGDFVWYDLDKDGIQDGGNETGIPNVTVTLTGTDGAGNPVNESTTTDANGFYLFDGLTPGTYKITFTSPGAGYIPSPQDQGGNDATDSDIAPGTLMTVTTVLTLSLIHI